MQKKTKRIENLIITLKRQPAVSIKELAGTLNVTEMTIRRDLQQLSKKNLVKVLHGAAIYTSGDRHDYNQDTYSYYEELTKRKAEKDRIGQKGASLIEPRDTIIIDSGSTTEYLAKYIQDDIPITVLSYALNIINIISEKSNCAQIISGGTFQRNTLSFVGTSGIDLVSQIRASKVFISASGISDNLGITCTNLYELDIKKAAINAANTRILLVDSSKFDRVNIAHFADMKDFDIIVTDTDIPERYSEMARELGITLHTV